MGKGFVLCAVVCSALALAVYAGLSEYLGFSSSFAVFLLLGICFLFHGTAIYMLSSREKIGISRQIDSTEEKSREHETVSSKEEESLSSSQTAEDVPNSFLR
jgi:hypothetical protein